MSRALASASVGAVAFALATSPTVDAHGKPNAASYGSCPDGASWVGGAVVSLGRGSDAAWPVHGEAILAFCIDRDEMSVDRFVGCIAEGHCFPARSCARLASVACLDLIEAREVCRAFGGDLPSEAQWEYAARGRVDRTNLDDDHAPFGLRAMGGGVLEWTRDPGPLGTTATETAIVKGPLIDSDPLSYRAAVPVRSHRVDLGFRCVYAPGTPASTRWAPP